MAIERENSWRGPEIIKDSFLGIHRKYVWSQRGWQISQ